MLARDVHSARSEARPVRVGKPGGRFTVNLLQSSSESNEASLVEGQNEEDLWVTSVRVTTESLSSSRRKP